MKAVQLPWHAVPQYATVVVDGRPYAVLNPTTTAPVVALRPLSGHILGARTMVIDPNAPVTMLIPEYDDALAILATHFDVSIMED